MKRIGDIITRNKTAVTVEDDTSYKQVTIRTHYKGVTLRGTQNGSTIGTKNQFRVSAGQFILSRIDARNGAFGIVPEELEGAIVTNDFLAFDINEDEVERDFFNVFLQSPVFLEACIKASRGNTNRKRVDEDFFLNYEVNLPPLSAQHRLIARIHKGRSAIALTQAEIKHQNTLLAKLKQSILQEAIQGKLTADWRASNPDVEPASKLLERIKAEKARLVAAKKLRPEKPLPKIADKDKPFEIPEGWEWCRPLDVCQTIVDCPHSTPTFVPEGKYCIDSTCIDFEGRIHLNLVRRVSGDTFLERNSRLVPDTGDIIYVREGFIGQAVIVPPSMQVCLGQRVMLYRPAKPIDSRWLRHVVTSKFFLDEVLQRHKGMGAKHINMSDLRSMPIPVPPLAEQAAIVERVEALMTTCRELEAEIENSRTHAEQLLQAVLKEAFAAS